MFCSVETTFNKLLFLYRTFVFFYTDNTKLVYKNKQMLMYMFVLMC